MPALFKYEMALAVIDVSCGLRDDGSNYWSVHCFDRMGRWTSGCIGLSKEEAIKKASALRRRARMERQTKHG